MKELLKLLTLYKVSLKITPLEKATYNLRFEIVYTGQYIVTKVSQEVFDYVDPKLSEIYFRQIIFKLYKYGGSKVCSSCQQPLPDNDEGILCNECRCTQMQTAQL